MEFLSLFKFWDRKQGYFNHVSSDIGLKGTVISVLHLSVHVCPRLCLRTIWRIPTSNILNLSRKPKSNTTDFIKKNLLIAINFNLFIPFFIFINFNYALIVTRIHKYLKWPFCLKYNLYIAYLTISQRKNKLTGAENLPYK